MYIPNKKFALKLKSQDISVDANFKSKIDIHKYSLLYKRGPKFLLVVALSPRHVVKVYCPASVDNTFTEFLSLPNVC